ncbi:hypothetical protein ACWDTQ_32535 [Streptomyces cellulosae]
MKINVNALAVIADTGNMSNPADRQKVSDKLKETNQRSSNGSGR